MKKTTRIYSVFIAVTFCFWINIVFGQNTQSKRINKLQTALNSAQNKRDSVKAFLGFSQELRISKPTSDSIKLFIQKAEELAVKAKNDSLLGEVYHEKGLYLSGNGNAEECIANYQKAFQFFEKVNDKKGQVTALAYLAQENATLNNVATAKQYIAQTQAIAGTINSDATLSSVYLAIGNVFKKLSSIERDAKGTNQTFQSYCDSSLWYFKKALVHERKLPEVNPVTLPLVLNNLASSYTDCGYSADSAIYYFRETLAISEKYGIQDTKLMALINIGRLQRKMGKLDSAFFYLTKAQEVSDTLKDKPLAMGLYRNWVFYWATKEDYKNAFVSIQDFYMTKLDLVSEEKSNALAEQEVRFQTQQKEQQIALQKANLATQEEELKNQRLLTGGVSAVLLLSLVFGAVFYRLNSKNKRLSTKNATLVREVNHRVKNNLQVLSSLLSLQSRRLEDASAKTAIEESQLRVSSMAFIHRRLYGEQLKEIQVSEYVEELVSHVTKSYGFREENLHTDLQIADTRFDVDTVIPLGLILNELVSNACKYAFEGNPNPGLSIALVPREDSWELTVKDNGRGFSEGLLQSAEKSNSFGLKLIRLQATQLEGKLSFKNQNGLLVSLLFSGMIQ